MTSDNFIGNLSTIAVWCWVIVAPYLVDYMTQDQFIALFTAIVGIALALFSSYHPNTFKFLNNDDDMPIGIQIDKVTLERILNDEYEVGIDDSEV